MNRSISTVWIFGLGTVGSALAALFAQNGLRVVGVVENPAALVEAQRRVHGRVTANSGPENSAQAILDRIDYTTGPELVSTADLVVEALPERLDDKCALLGRINGLSAEETVFLTTTTGLSVTEIASRSGRMPRVLGLHLTDFNTLPTATAMEVVRTPLTEATASRTVLEFVRGLGRTPILVHDHPGFIGGALMLGYLNSAATMYQHGYGSRDDIDAAMTMGCGLPSGPLAQLDSIGLDTVHDTLTALYERSGDKAYAPAPILASMAAGKLLGAKSGRGFYTYDDTGRRLGSPDDTSGPGAGRDSDEPGQREALSTAASPRMGSEVRPVGRIGIVGSGNMAAGIAEVCVRGGFPVTLVARTDIRAKEARASVERSCARAVERGKMTREDMAGTMDRLTTTVAMDELGAADLVIEAVVEDLDVKLEVFAALDNVTKPGSVLATITSSLPVIKCAMATRRPEDVVGMHFFNPAPKMKLIEVVRTFASADDAVATVHALASALGKHTVNCTDRTGFIVNALLFPYLNRAATMLRDQSASVEDIDTVISGGSGFPLGPFQLLDLIGLDVSLAIQDRLWRTFPESESTPARYLDDLVRAGFLGRKTGRGFYAHATP